MTDNNQGNSFDQNSTPAVAPVSHETQTQQEKMVPQSRVDHIAKDAWHRGYEKAAAERERVMQQREQQQQPSNPQQLQQPAHDDFDAKFDAKFQAELKNIQEREARKQYDSQMQQIANDFVGKVNSGKSKYADFDQKIGEVGYESIAHLVPELNKLENVADVVYELVENPAKIASITSLAGINPNLARAELQRLSQSVKRNEEAKGKRYPDEPLSPLSHSNTGKDGGSNTVGDFKRADWLRG